MAKKQKKKSEHNEPRIVFYDLETAPSRGFTWGKWEQNVIYFDQHWYILSFAYQVLGETTIHVKRLCDYPGYKKNLTNDLALCQDLWKLFDGADILVGQNIDAFDCKKANARFAKHGMTPPSPYKTVDTLKIMRRRFKLDSNKLDDAAVFFDLGRKLPHHGVDMWRGCMEGDPKAWTEMKAYNAHDVELTHDLYLKIRSWTPNHPNFNHWTRGSGCPTCQSGHVHHRGYAYTKTGRSPRLCCQECGSWSQGQHERYEQSYEANIF